MASDGLVVVLGGGGARGLAHVGVLETLADRGIPIRAIVGTSIGAEIGAFRAAGFPLDELRRMGTAMDWRKTLQLFMPDLAAGGLCSGRRILDFLKHHFGDRLIEDLPVQWIGIATDLDSGDEVVLDRGCLAQAVRASISLPGLLAPYRLGDRLLIDGGVVNPLPIDVARRHFGGPVLAVSLQSASVRSRAHPRPAQWASRARRMLQAEWVRKAKPLRTWLAGEIKRYDRRDKAWRTRWVLAQSANITQASLVRLRLEQTAPDVLLRPEVQHIGPLEFYRGAEAIEAGRREAVARLSDIEQLVGR